MLARRTAPDRMARINGLLRRLGQPAIDELIAPPAELQNCKACAARPSPKTCAIRAAVAIAGYIVCIWAFDKWYNAPVAPNLGQFKWDNVRAHYLALSCEAQRILTAAAQ